MVVSCAKVHKTWLEVIDVPPSSAEKDWELQVCLLFDKGCSVLRARAPAPTGPASRCLEPGQFAMGIDSRILERRYPYDCSIATALLR